MVSSCFVSAALFIDSSVIMHLTRCSSFPDFRMRFLSQKRHLSAGNSRDDFEWCENLRLFTELCPSSELLLGACFLRFKIRDTFVKRNPLTPEAPETARA